VQAAERVSRAALDRFCNVVSTLGAGSSGVGDSTRGSSLGLVDSPAADMDKASVIEFDDDISAFNGVVAVTTRNDRLPFHTVRAREDEEEASAMLSRGRISFAHTEQMSFSYAMEPRYRLIATGRSWTKVQWRHL
jgi:hypothetical protein